MGKVSMSFELCLFTIPSSGSGNLEVSFDVIQNGQNLSASRERVFIPVEWVAQGCMLLKIQRFGPQPNDGWVSKIFLVELGIIFESDLVLV